MKKVNKTTIIGITLLATVLVGLAFVWFGKATLTEVGGYIGPVFSALTALGFIAASDKGKVQ
jgi:hypothetical protein